MLKWRKWKECIRCKKRNLEQLKNYRLLDDDFMTVVFKNSDCAELLLRIVLNKPDIKVINVETQDYFKNLEGRFAILDIYAVDTVGTHYDIEVQRSDKGAVMKRSRYNGSLMDASQMHYDILAERVQYFKENEERIRTMCKAMEDRIVAERNEKKINNTVENIRSIMENMKWTVE